MNWPISLNQQFYMIERADPPHNIVMEGESFSFGVVRYDPPGRHHPIGSKVFYRRTQSIVIDGERFDLVRESEIIGEKN